MGLEEGSDPVLSGPIGTVTEGAVGEEEPLPLALRLVESFDDGCQVVPGKERSAGDRIGWKQDVARPKAEARIGKHFALPDRELVFDDGSIVATDTATQIEPLPCPLLGGQILPWRIQGQRSSREGKGDGVALMVRPTVLPRVVSPAGGTAAHELPADETHHGGDLLRGQPVGEALHAGTRTSHADRIDHRLSAEGIQARGAEISRLGRQECAREGIGVARVGVAVVAVRIVDGATELVVPRLRVVGSPIEVTGPGRHPGEGNGDDNP